MPGITTTRFECVDQARNKKAFYMLSIERGLFCFMLVRRWGRIGRRGRSLSKCFLCETDILREYKRLHRKRLQRGYTLAE